MCKEIANKLITKNQLHFGYPQKVGMLTSEQVYSSTCYTNLLTLITLVSKRTFNCTVIQ